MSKKQNVILLVLLLLGVVLTMLVNSLVGSAIEPVVEQGNAKQLEVLNDFCEYVADKDIEYISSSANPLKSDSLTVKLYEEEPRTFEPLRSFTRISSADNKYHVYLREDGVIIIHAPVDGVLQPISN
jgi:hypothetical protein